MVENLQRVGFLAFIPQLLREFDVEPACVLLAAQLGPAALDDPEASIPYAAMGRLLEASVTHTGCEHFGLLLGQRAGTSSLGLIGELMSHAPNLGAAMKDLVVHQHRHARGAVVYLLEQEDEVLFGYAIYENDMEGAMQVYDGAVALAVSIIRKAIGTECLDGLEVLLSRARPHDIEAYRRCFGVRLHFDSELTGVLVPRRWMDRPVIGADPAKRRLLEKRIESYWQAGDFDVVTRLRRALRVGMLTGSVSGDDMAEKLGLSRRTLHRRLEDQGVNFQQILDETRFEFARQLLSNTALGIAQIGTVLRYADPSVFTRAFTRWSGVPPHEWAKDRPPHRSNGLHHHAR